MNNKFVSRLKILLVVCSLTLLSACATTSLDERDPWEGFNRGVFSFNEAMDNVVFEPVGKVYDFITPDIIDNGVSNFFSNIAQIPVIANSLLQFKFDQAVNDTVRLFLNSSIGLLGFFDVAGEGNLHSSGADFGQTLAHWGMGPGPYLVVPFFGPTTVRDGTGFAVDRGLLSPIAHIDDDLTQAGLLSLNYVDFKSDILSTTDLIGEAAVDEYDFIKNAYFEKRNSHINGSGFPDDFPTEQ
ncbi:MAG: VacJ family lipoprotein [Pseudomonadota bacterium]